MTKVISNIQQTKWLADEVYPNAEKIIMVCDNLNTHDKSSFYEAFLPAEALRLSKRFEFHYTPKHGSWLDIAEHYCPVKTGN